MTDNERYAKLQRLHNERMARVVAQIDAADAAKRTVTDTAAEIAQLRAELDDLRWQRDQADSYGGYMRHCIRPIPFAEWIARQRARMVGKTIAADELIERLRERRDEVQP